MASNTIGGAKGSQRLLLAWLFRQGRAAALWMGLSAGCGMAGGILVVAQAAVLSRILGRAAADGAPPGEMTLLFTVGLAVVLLRAGAGWGRQEAGFAAGAKVRERLRSAVLERFFSLGPAVSAGRHSAEAAAIALDRVESLHGFYSLYLPQLAVAAAVPCVIVAAVFPVSWAAAGLLLFTAPLIPLFMVLVGMGAESVSQKHFEALGRLGARFLDVLQGMETLKRFGRSRGRSAEISRASEQYRRRTMGVLRVAFLSSAVLEFFSSISIALVAVYLGLSYLGYLDFGLYGLKLSLENGLFILLLAPEFYAPLRDLGAHYHARAEAVGAAGEIAGLLRKAPGAPPRAVSAPVGPGRIRFENVSFFYGGQPTPVLENLDFSMAPGRCIFLVGESGEGKTTILSLLLRFIAPSAGRILVDGKPLSETPPDAWRRRIAWIGQEPRLFSGSIRENICLGRPEATGAQIEAAAAAAQVTEFLPRLARGLDEQVGEGGRLLSRGQAQRVALARALLVDASVLLLDEPLAGLDAQTEAAVSAALKRLGRKKSVLWVTHRLGAVDPEDRLLILSGGRIREAGPDDSTAGYTACHHNVP